MASDDVYGDSLWPVLTAEDFDEIDRLSESQEGSGQNSGTSCGRPQVEIEVEHAADDAFSKANIAPEHSDKKKKSLYDIFRRRSGFLSVTDCVGPSWCEVQYDYGLRQCRTMPINSRPKSFKTDKGKEIVVERKVAEKREKIVNAGTAVHKVLEEEMGFEEFQVCAATREETWALRLLDFITRMKILEQDSFCREIQVWGIVQDQVILGCIDELRLIPNPDKKRVLKSSPPKKAKAAIPDPQQRTIHEMMQPNSAPSPEPASSKVIQLIDMKTRGANNVPSHADTLPSRLQLMLYRQLLVDVLRADPATLLDFWARLDCDVGLPFSERFKTDLSVMVVSNELDLRFLDAGCLLDMLEPMQESMGQLVTREVAQSLSLVYRRRNNVVKGHKTRRPENASKAMEFESQKESPPLVEEKTVATRTGKDSPNRKRKHEEMCSKDSDANPSTQSAPSTSEVVPTQALQDKSLIGTKKFKFNSQLLEEHMKSILQWWNGERPSIGVSLENAHRCRSCEYREDCEWREAKSREMSKKK